MNPHRHTIAALTLSFGLFSTLVGAADVRIAGGKVWRGDTGAQVRVVVKESGVERTYEGAFLKLDGKLLTMEVSSAGKPTRKTVYATDILSMTTLGGAADVADQPEDAAAQTGATTAPGAAAVAPGTATGAKRQVFILPVDGMVGVGLRHNEMEAIEKVADSFGEGQLIILRVNSNGGLVIEGDQIEKTLQRLRTKHRLISWIEKAISGGAFTGVQAEEVYFLPTGSLGSITMIQGLTAVTGAANEYWMQNLERVMEENGHEKHLGRCMVNKEYELSYDKDPETGKVTWYKTLEGEFDLSDANENLDFNASNAEHCGFSKGTAATLPDLMRIVGWPEGTYEVNKEGQAIYERWQRTMSQCKERVPRIWDEMEYKNQASGDPVVILGTRIQLFKEFLGWYDRAWSVIQWELNINARKDDLERELKRMEKELADLRKARRGAGGGGGGSGAGG